jgi:dihydrofolate synthase/folylpolyglutamate synthase
MTYADAIRFLYDLRRFGAKLGLENTRKLAALVGNPQRELRFIHVAGTNGKGSTCAMLDSVYRAAGLRTGLFTSPHLVSFRERIQVNRQLTSESDIVRLVERIQPLLRNFPDDHHPTFFEVVTVMALVYFEEQKCDLIIWEAGLGGRLDATNIVIPLVSVITNIQYDHEKWLGHTLRQIAAEKAGIIKSGVPVVTTVDEPEAFAVILDTAKRLGAPFTRVTSEQANHITHHISLPLLGDHQRLNAALAVRIVEVLNDKIPVPKTCVGRGLESVEWPGRMQVITHPSGQKILLDGAHNVAGAQALRATLEKNFPGEKPSIILGILEDKDWQKICTTLAPSAARIFAVRVSSDRTADAYRLAQACYAINPSIDVSVCDSLAHAIEKVSADATVVVTGSLYLVGEALELLGVSSAGSAERALNEWGTTPGVAFAMR